MKCPPKHPKSACKAHQKCSLERPSGRPTHIASASFVHRSCIHRAFTVHSPCIHPAFNVHSPCIQCAPRVRRTAPPARARRVAGRGFFGDRPSHSERDSSHRSALKPISSGTARAVRFRAWTFGPANGATNRSFAILKFRLKQWHQPGHPTSCASGRNGRGTRRCCRRPPRQPRH